MKPRKQQYVDVACALLAATGRYADDYSKYDIDAKGLANDVDRILQALPEYEAQPDELKKPTWGRVPVGFTP